MVVCGNAVDDLARSVQTADSEHLVALTVPVVLPAAVGSVLPDKSSLVSAPVLLTSCEGV